MQNQKKKEFPYMKKKNDERFNCREVMQLVYGNRNAITLNHLTQLIAHAIRMHLTLNFSTAKSYIKQTTECLWSERTLDMQRVSYILLSTPWNCTTAVRQLFNHNQKQSNNNQCTPRISNNFSFTIDIVKEEECHYFE